MSFLGSLFLLALPLISIPVLIHFLRRRRREVMPWGAMQFLRVTHNRDSRLSNWDRWLLMMLRILALACLIGALARPAFHFASSQGQSLTPQVLLIDDTRSTLTVDAGGKATFEKIREAGLRILRDVPAGTPIEAWAIGTPERRISTPAIAGSADAAAIERALRSFVPRGGGANFAASIRRVASSAMATLQASDASSQPASSLSIPRLDLWLLTDGLRAGWDEQLTAIQVAGEPRNHLHVVTMTDERDRSAASSQLCVASVLPDRTRVTAGDVTRLTATIVNQGNRRSANTEGVWRRNGEVFATSVIAPLEPSGTTVAEIDVKAAEAGTSAITLSLQNNASSNLSDPLADDDENGTVIQVLGRQPILVITGNASLLGNTPTEADYLSAALGKNLGAWKGRSSATTPDALNWQSLYRPVVKHADELADLQWHAYTVIVVLNDAWLPERIQKQMADSVRSGCGLWVTVGSDSDVTFVDELARRLGMSGGQTNQRLIGDLVVRTSSETMDRVHPPEITDTVVGALSDTERLDLDEVRIRRRRELTVQPSDQTRTLLRTFSGDPLVMLSSFGRGRVILQGIPLDPSWSNFSLSNAYVVYISEVLDHLANPLAEQHHLAAGRMIRARVLDPNARYEIQTPDGTSEEVIALASSDNSESGIVRYQGTDRPGSYTLVNLDRPPEEAGGERPIHYWIDSSIDESKIHESSVAQLQTLAAHKQIQWVDGASSFDPQPIFRTIQPQQVERPGSPIWPWFLLGMVIAILLETFLSGFAALRRYGRFRPSLKEPSTVGQHQSSIPSESVATPSLSISGWMVMPMAQSTSSGSISSGDELTITEGITTEGWLGMPSAIGVGVLIAFVTLIWLYRQRELLGRYTTALIVCLRLAVVGTAIWMLAEPTWTKTETLSRHAEILLIADASPSMGTVDSLESPNIALWARATDLDRTPDDQDHLKTALFHLRMAARGEERQGAFSTEALKLVGDQLRKLSSDSMVAAAPILALIESAQSAAAEAADAGNLAEQRALLASQVEAVASAQIELQTLVDAQQRGQNSSSVDSTRSRIEYLSTFLQQTEQRWNHDANANSSGAPIRIRRAVFAHRVRSIDDEDESDWSVRLSNGHSVGDVSLTDADLADREDPRTDLSEAITFAGSLAASRNVAAIVMLSEGQHNAASDLTPVEAASGLPDIPVFTVAIGDTARRRDIAVHRVSAPPVVYTDDSPVIEVIVSAYQCQNDSVDVRLKLGDEVIETKVATFHSEQSDVAIEFEVPRRGTGRHEYSIDVDSVDGEADLQNNHGFVAIETIKSKLYVLIADGRPRWESRYLEQLFRRDSRVQLDKVLLQPKVKTSVGTIENPLPQDADQWAKFDVVILGDLPPSVLTPPVRAAIIQYVKNGGRLLVVAGRQFMPAAYVQAEPEGNGDQNWFDLFPVTADPMPVSAHHRPSPTMEGMLTRMFRFADTVEESDLIWQRAMRGPQPGFVSPYHAAKPSATVLATLAFQGDAVVGSQGTRTTQDDSSATPVWLAMHRFGRGRIAYLSSPVTYRLRVRRGDEFHHQFWGQLVRHLTSAELASGDGAIRIQTDRSQYTEGSEPRVRVRLRSTDGQPVRGGSLNLHCESVENTADRTASEIASIEMQEDQQVPGTYLATIPVLNPGVYRTWASGDPIQTSESESISANFTVQASAGLESLMTQANPVLMRQIAETSGGLAIEPSLVREIPNAVSLSPEITEARLTKPLWNRWSCLWTIVGCLSAEWFLRRRRGLI